jgi:hypothetical protein
MFPLMAGKTLRPQPTTLSSSSAKKKKKNNCGFVVLCHKYPAE